MNLKTIHNKGATITTTTLPELRSGQVLVSPRGFEYIVHRVTGKRKREAAFDEPLYQLERTVRCNGVYALDELVKMGLTLKESP